ncbi:hypothetical protein CsSME_00053034 [Camellia sinensis var. sinensis]
MGGIGKEALVVCSDELGDRNNNIGHREWGKSPPHTNQCFTSSWTHLLGKPVSCGFSDTQAGLSCWWGHLYLALQ